MTEVHFRPNMAGIRSVLKGAGCRAALQDAADGMADEANDRARAHFEGNLTVPPYGSAVDEHSHVAVGRVFTRTRMGRLDQARHHTLDGVNH